VVKEAQMGRFQANPGKAAAPQNRSSMGKEDRNTAGAAAAPRTAQQQAGGRSRWMGLCVEIIKKYAEKAALSFSPARYYRGPGFFVKNTPA